MTSFYVCNRLFSTGFIKWNTVAIKIFLSFLAGLFIEFSDEKCATCKRHGKQLFPKICLVSGSGRVFSGSEI